MHEDDESLLRRLQHNDADAMRQIYLRYKDDLLTAALCLAGQLVVAEDCVHDAFVRFVQASSRLKLRGSLKAYLITCVANKARDYLRSKVHVLALPEAGEWPAASESDPVCQAAAAEQTQWLMQALTQLPFEQREVVTLRIHAELTFREIASRQDVSINTVQARYRYALEKLHTILAGAKP